MNRKRIAIIGSGFAGLAACWHLLQHRVARRITIFDPLDPIESASGLSSGLLHPYAGRRAIRNHRASEGMAATRNLLDIASASWGSPVYRASGLLRLPESAEQEADFRACAANNGDAEWWEERRCRERLPGSEAWAGLYIRSGLAVDSVRYIEGVRAACLELGAEWIKEKISSVDSLRSEYDAILVAAGYASTALLPEAKPKLRPIKGQLLHLRWPQKTPYPTLPVFAPKQLIPLGDGESVVIGSTFECHPTSEAPDVEVSREKLLQPLYKLYPTLTDAEIVACHAAYRAATAGQQPPEWVQVDPQVWRYAGLGSKGLLYHALMKPPREFS